MTAILIFALVSLVIVLGFGAGFWMSGLYQTISFYHRDGRLRLTNHGPHQLKVKGREPLQCGETIIFGEHGDTKE